jgi:hypothetical protein
VRRAVAFSGDDALADAWAGRHLTDGAWWVAAESTAAFGSVPLPTLFLVPSRIVQVRRVDGAMTALEHPRGEGTSWSPRTRGTVVTRVDFERLVDAGTPVFAADAHALDEVLGGASGTLVLAAGASFSLADVCDELAVPAVVREGCRARAGARTLSIARLARR